MSTLLVDLVVDVFNALNERIRFLYDRDHQLGHSYFLDVTDAASLRQVFLDRIVPMLQEYFYGAWDEIVVVRGIFPYDESGEPRRRDAHLLDKGTSGKTYAYPLVRARRFTEFKTLGFDHDDYEDRVDYGLDGLFQEGRLSAEDLHRVFLGILTLDGSAFDRRLEALVGKAAAAPGEAEVQG